MCSAFVDISTGDRAPRERLYTQIALCCLRAVCVCVTVRAPSSYFIDFPIRKIRTHALAIRMTCQAICTPPQRPSTDRPADRSQPTTTLLTLWPHCLPVKWARVAVMFGMGAYSTHEPHMCWAHTNTTFGGGAQCVRESACSAADACALTIYITRGAYRRVSTAAQHCIGLSSRRRRCAVGGMSNACLCRCVCVY